MIGDVSIRSDLARESFTTWPSSPPYTRSKVVELLTEGGMNGQLFMEGRLMVRALECATKNGMGDADMRSDLVGQSFTTWTSSMPCTRSKVVAVCTEGFMDLVHRWRG